MIGLFPKWRHDPRKLTNQRSTFQLNPFSASYFFENFESLKNVGLAEKLINAGAKIDAFGGPSLSTPLHLAASYEDTEMVKMLLEYGADPFKKDGDGNFRFLTPRLSEGTQKFSKIHFSRMAY